MLYYSDLGREASVSEAGREIEVTYLAKGALANTTEENEMEEVYFSVKVYGLEITGCLSFGDGAAGREDIPLDDSRRHPCVFVFVITRSYSVMINENRCRSATVGRPRW